MFVKSVSFLPASIKSMNPMQKYLHITELFACTWKMLGIMFLFPINYLISSGTCSTQKLSKTNNPAKIFPNRLAPNVPKNMLQNPPSCSFVSFLIVLVTKY